MELMSRVVKAVSEMRNSCMAIWDFACACRTYKEEIRMQEVYEYG